MVGVLEVYGFLVGLGVISFLSYVYVCVGVFVYGWLVVVCWVSIVIRGWWIVLE